jgi:hypothetical protein
MTSPSPKLFRISEGLLYVWKFGSEYSRNKLRYNVRSDVPKAVNVELWVMIPCSLVDMYERFEETCCFLLQGKMSINISTA